MDLETPQTIRCPLCGTQTGNHVELKLNSGDKPMFYCRTFGSAHNLRPDRGDAESAEKVLQAAVDAVDDGTELESTDANDDETETDEPGDKTIDDLFKTDE